ncbi:MAG: hypothetical protein JSU78_01500 [Deltaproteobacteria bacterium]|nr:MAG: hypothetical protein JSU78_01500 [Deltaproteobacteria bacterium]
MPQYIRTFYADPGEKRKSEKGRRGRRKRMKILSIRRGFQADHSSTSYEFFAVEKPLNRSQREAVSDLSSRANLFESLF